MLSLLAFFLSPILSDRRATINKAKNNDTLSRTRTLLSPLPPLAISAIPNATTTLLLRLLSLNYLTTMPNGYPSIVVANLKRRAANGRQLTFNVPVGTLSCGIQPLGFSASNYYETDRTN